LGPAELQAQQSAQLLVKLREEAGLDLAALTPTQAGQSGSAFWVTDRAGPVSLLKLAPGPAPAALAYLRALQAALARLTRRGYPVPRWQAVGQADGRAFWIQERITGATLETADARPHRELIARLLPELLRLNDAQSGLASSGPGAPGQGDLGWPELITSTLTEGGHGYCVHATLDRPGLRDLLDAIRRIGAGCGPAIPAGGDFVHYDFNLANLLSDGQVITGVIDLNPPVLAGDRAFDLATLLYYLYDYPEIAGPLAARLFSLAGEPAARAYLAHMVLRQADWSLRFYPGAAATRRHVHLARLVIADVG
jgi:Ser/Thr protein kinase RdoA (MazF antagonist)